VAALIARADWYVWVRAVSTHTHKHTHSFNPRFSLNLDLN
jgi:hypothetical protein